MLFLHPQVDIFSYGVMMVHVLSGQWPFPGEANIVNPRNPNDPNDLVGVTEFDRREEYMNKIGNQQPIMRLIQLCLSNSTSHRPASSEVHQQVSAVAADHPPSFANRVEMLERIKSLREEKETMRMEKNNAVSEKEAAVGEREQVLAELSNMDRLRQSHSIQLVGVQLEVSDLKAEIEQLQTIVKIKERELEVNKCNHQEEIKAKERELEVIREASDNKVAALRKEHQAQLDSKASELSSKDVLISSKSSIIQSLQEKLGQALGTSSSKDRLNVFSPGVKLNFTECAKLPRNYGIGHAIVIGKDVYVNSVADIFKYSITNDTWSTLPVTPVERFSIGYLCQKIILVGGRLPANNQVTGDIHEFDEASQQWVRSTSIPPMPTARQATTVVSWTSPTALIVCGGSDEHKLPMNVVEVYHSRTSQWHAVSPLPFQRDWITHTVIHNELYLVGGYKESNPESYTNTVLSASIPQLLESCLQPSTTPPVQWQSLSIPDTPLYYSSAASLGGCLLVVGGSTRPYILSGYSLSSVHAYCPSSSSWVLVGELPQPLAGCITATLPTGELLVMGGRSTQRVSMTTYKCCLSIQTKTASDI